MRLVDHPIDRVDHKSASRKSSKADEHATLRRLQFVEKAKELARRKRLKVEDCLLPLVGRKR